MEVGTIEVQWQSDTKPEGAQELNQTEEKGRRDFTYIVSLRGYNPQNDLAVMEDEDFNLYICGGGETTTKLFFCASRKRGVKAIIGKETLLDSNAFFKIAVPLKCAKRNASQPQEVFLNFYRKENGKPYNVTASKRIFTVNRQSCAGFLDLFSGWC